MIVGAHWKPKTMGDGLRKGSRQWPRNEKVLRVSRQL